MIYEGKAVTVKPVQDGIVELNFDLQGESVNKFNRLTVEELGEAAKAMGVEIQACANPKCKCPHCTCGPECSCNVSLAETCDACAEFKTATLAIGP